MELLSWVPGPRGSVIRAEIIMVGSRLCPPSSGTVTQDRYGGCSSARGVRGTAPTICAGHRGGDPAQEGPGVQPTGPGWGLPKPLPFGECSRPPVTWSALLPPGTVEDPEAAGWHRRLSDPGAVGDHVILSAPRASPPRRDLGTPTLVTGACPGPTPHTLVLPSLTAGVTSSPTAPAWRAELRASEQDSPREEVRIPREQQAKVPTHRPHFWGLFFL